MPRPQPTVRSRRTTDARFVKTTFNLRVPFWRLEELRGHADRLGVEMSVLINDALDRMYEPNPPEQRR